MHDVSILAAWLVFERLSCSFRAEGCTQRSTTQGWKYAMGMLYWLEAFRFKTSEYI